ncbi:MAG: 30S ribosomal protein S16 [Flavobacteriales bacterium]|nr:30S ribosomal protein S16 [Flavobacteriales bacterium]
MSVKIRLQRHGRRKRPFYHIVVTDSRSPRNGRFIQRLGSYDPNHEKAIVTLNFDSAVEWVKKGAQPSDTCRVLLSQEGVMLKKHLDQGVTKGALTAEDAEKKFSAWVSGKEKRAEEKVNKQQSRKEAKAKAKAEAKKKEAEANAPEAAAPEAPAAEAEAAAPAEEAPKAEDSAEEKA